VFVKTLLRQVGIEETWEAGDGVQGLAMIAQHSPQLVLLDVNLPVMSGIEVLRALSEEGSKAPVIMLTSQSSMKTVVECVKLGAEAYILKHSPKAEALKVLGETLDAIANRPDGAEEPAE
jgi:CheY-like chemotaxis protein